MWYAPCVIRSHIYYSGMEFYRLVQEIEAQEGTHLDIVHEPKSISIPKQARGGQPMMNLIGAGCNEAAVFAVPFERGVFAGSPESDQLIEIGETLTTNAGRDKGSDPIHMAMAVDKKDDQLIVCAVDDGVGLWPRFIGTWEDDE